MLLIKSTSDSPEFNGELEKKYLTEPPLQDVLLLYINRPSAIVGRNQCIEAEVNVNYCLQHNIKVIKRISGGGTVYHDYGNINYAFISPKGNVPVLERDFSTPILSALESMNINAVVGSRKEILVDGKKISGTASHITRDRILFHGTLLHQTDLTQLQQVLKGNPSLRGNNVASVPSPVINLAEITQADETTIMFLDKLISFFEKYYHTKVK